MHKKKRSRDLTPKYLLLRGLVLIGTIALIVYFLPRDMKFSYQFDVNKPWKYGQLIAAFDFPIYKPDEVVKREQDSILKAVEPYYILDKSVEQEHLLRLRTDYQNQLRKILPSAEYYQHILRMLKSIYTAGIVSSQQMEKLHQDSVKGIMIVDEKVAFQQSTSSIYSEKDAYNYLLMADTLHFKPGVLRQCSLNQYLTPNLTYDEARTQTAQEDIFNDYSWATGLVVSGQKIIDRGEIISPATYNILESLRKESIKRSETDRGQFRLKLTGQVLFVSIFIFLFVLYLILYRKDYFDDARSLLLIFSIMVFLCLITELMMKNNLLSVYMVPYAMAPIILRTFLDSRTAFVSHMVTIIICSICLRYPHEFILVQMAAGLIGIYSLRELSQRSQLFSAAIYVTLTSMAVYFAFELFSEGDLKKLYASMYVYFAISGILLLFIYPLMFMIEKVFGFTSNVTLVELSNTNNPLLRTMSETCPGTFQHSLQIANLASEAAIRVGANSQLVRTGALYHDIGKMENPVFFTENQGSGVNPHKNLSYEQSAQVVINHVTDGLKLADKNNLPSVVKDFISTHHGKGKTKYFYISWKNEHPTEDPDEKLFTYPGPNPFTLEQAILMMADAVEATSRSLPEYTEESISAVVDKIIDSQVSEGYFKECPITFLDISRIKHVFKEKLKTMYHTRISYPEPQK